MLNYSEAQNIETGFSLIPFGPVHTGGDHVILGRQVPIATTSMLSAPWAFSEAVRLLLLLLLHKSPSGNLLQLLMKNLCVVKYSLKPVHSVSSCFQWGHLMSIYVSLPPFLLKMLLKGSHIQIEWYATFLYKCRNSKQPNDRWEHSSVTFLVDALVKWLSIDWRY